MDTLLDNQTPKRSSLIEFNGEEKFFILSGLAYLIKNEKYFLTYDNIKNDKHKTNVIQNKIKQIEELESALYNDKGLNFNQRRLVLDALAYEWHHINTELYLLSEKNKSEPIKNYKEEENFLIKCLEKVHTSKSKVFLWLYDICLSE